MTTLTLLWNAGTCQGATQTFTVRDADDTVPTGGYSVSVSSASLTELTPGKSYTFTVTATCGGQTSDTSSGKTESMSKFKKAGFYSVILATWPHPHHYHPVYILLYIFLPARRLYNNLF